MKTKNSEKQNPREIPVRKDPYSNPPAKAPSNTPEDQAPGRDNPRNPQEDTSGTKFI